MDENVTKTDLLGRDSQTLIRDLTMAGFPVWRSKDILHWIFDKHIVDLRAITSLNKEAREELARRFEIGVPQLESEKVSADGTRKFLLRLADEALIESALIPAPGKNTLCVSSQVGCARQCRFCATALMGLKRNLTVAEILGQVVTANHRLDQLGMGTLTNLVFMGMGEPMDNLDHVLEAVKQLQCADTFRFSPRRVTLSTCGVIPGIRRAAESGIKMKLAVSLNAAIQGKREKLMPVAAQYPLEELKTALLDFRAKTAYRVTLEYIMIKNFSMFDEDVRALKRFSNDLSCKINLIPWNPVAGLPWEAPDEDDIQTFRRKLEALNAAVTLRKSRGGDIGAACGQLAATKTDKKVKKTQ